MDQHYCLFDTAIGPCGIAWNERGLTRLQLPQSDGDATENRLRAKSAGASPARPSPAAQRAIAEIQRYLTGTKVDFSPIAIDLDHTDPLHRRIYAMARSIAWGQTVTYGELAQQSGCPGEAREVGQAMARNPMPVIIPCHRVLAAGNKVGGFSAYGGTFTKERLLALEGVHVGVAADAPPLPGILQPQRRTMST